MLGCVTFGTNDREKSAGFYDRLSAVCGAKRIMELDGFTLRGRSMEVASIAIAKPYNGEPA
ncbi:MAG: hypothetical protein ACJAYC_000329 [Halieaceae bacterium]|jgi:hypothetical protein